MDQLENERLPTMTLSSHSVRRSVDCFLFVFVAVAYLSYCLRTASDINYWLISHILIVFAPLFTKLPLAGDCEGTFWYSKYLIEANKQR